jgi:outer membrane protein assembly factor BamA
LSFAHETRTSVYNYDTGDLLDRQRTVTPVGQPLYLAEPQVAIVYDTSLFGATSPIFGSRSRFEIGQSLGDLTYTSVLVDVRRYAMPVRPVTIAVRGLHFGRYGHDSENPQLVDFYAGYPELVHGYDFGSSDARYCTDPAAGGSCVIFNNLRGSRILVANVEVRAPLMGLLKGQLDYGRVPVEIAGFFDAGVAWSSQSRPSFAGGTRQVIRSVGVAARANVFGFLTLELSAAHPFDRAGGGLQWQVGIRRGF